MDSFIKQKRMQFDSIRKAGPRDKTSMSQSLTPPLAKPSLISVLSWNQTHLLRVTKTSSRSDGTNVLKADNEPGRYVGLPELHNGDGEQQMNPRERHNSSRSPRRNTDCFCWLLCSTAATHKRVKDTSEQ